MGFTAFFLVSFRFILRTWVTAGVLCTTLMVMFFTFGQVANAVEHRASRLNLDLNLPMLGVLWLSIFLLLAYVLIRIRLTDTVTFFLNLTSFFLMAFPLSTMLLHTYFQVGSSISEGDNLNDIRGTVAAEASMDQLSPSAVPAIYYIILDAYERADVLIEIYAYDNSAIIHALEARGFYAED